MPCTASPPTRRAIYIRLRLITASACKGSCTKAWGPSPRKIKAPSGRNRRGIRPARPQPANQESDLRPGGAISSGGQAYAPAQLAEAPVLAQRVEHRIYIQVNEPAGAVLIGLLKPLEGPVFVPQPDINSRDPDGLHVGLFRPFLEVVQNLDRVQRAAGDGESAS